VIVVDDGLATGSTMRAAVEALRRQQPARIVVAVPTAAADTCELLRREADEVVCPSTPHPYRAVGLWYQDFSQTSDEDVRDLLALARRARAAVGQRPLRIPAGAALLNADLSLPAAASGLVLFAHGSGSSRFSPRNRHVARLLNEAGLATVLADLLTPDEEALDERTRHLRFDIGLLAERLVAASDWLQGAVQTARLPVGCFGASTGAGAALVAAAQRSDAIRAVVSRGGRPDLAGAALAQVRAPTLLIVGGNDVPVIELNRQALAQLGGEKKLVIVPGATHLFEEAGALDSVAGLAREWFLRYLPNGG
jgi:putative phosphoribosyl transferase